MSSKSKRLRWMRLKSTDNNGFTTDDKIRAWAEYRANLPHPRPVEYYDPSRVRCCWVLDNMNVIPYQFAQKKLLTGRE